MSNSDPNDPLDKGGIQPWIDPDVEARIVAAVLGEASDFERAGLDRLLEENPELAVFKRRIEAVHGLVDESFGKVNPAGADAGSADEWRLAPERRDALLAVFSQASADDAGGAGAEPESLAEVKSKVTRVCWRRWIGGLSAAAALAVFLAVASISRIESLAPVMGKVQDLAEFNEAPSVAEDQQATLGRAVAFNAPRYGDSLKELEEIRKLGDVEDVVAQTSQSLISGGSNESRARGRKLAAEQAPAITGPVAAPMQGGREGTSGDAADLARSRFSFGDNNFPTGAGEMQITSKFVEVPSEGAEELGFGWIDQAEQPAGAEPSAPVRRQVAADQSPARSNRTGGAELISPSLPDGAVAAKPGLELGSVAAGVPSAQKTELNFRDEEGAVAVDGESSFESRLSGAGGDVASRGIQGIEESLSELEGSVAGVESRPAVVTRSGRPADVDVKRESLFAQPTDALAATVKPESADLADSGVEGLVGSKDAVASPWRSQPGAIEVAGSTSEAAAEEVDARFVTNEYFAQPELKGTSGVSFSEPLSTAGKIDMYHAMVPEVQQGLGGRADSLDLSTGPESFDFGGFRLSQEGEGEIAELTRDFDNGIGVGPDRRGAGVSGDGLQWSFENPPAAGKPVAPASRFARFEGETEAQMFGEAGSLKQQQVARETLGKDEGRGQAKGAPVPSIQQSSVITGGVTALDTTIRMAEEEADGGAAVGFGVAESNTDLQMNGALDGLESQVKLNAKAGERLNYSVNVESDDAVKLDGYSVDGDGDQNLALLEEREVDAPTAPGLEREKGVVVGFEKRLKERELLSGVETAADKEESAEEGASQFGRESTVKKPAQRLAEKSSVAAPDSSSKHAGFREDVLKSGEPAILEQLAAEAKKTVVDGTAAAAQEQRELLRSAADKFDAAAVDFETGLGRLADQSGGELLGDRRGLRSDLTLEQAKAASEQDKKAYQEAVVAKIRELEEARAELWKESGKGFAPVTTTEELASENAYSTFSLHVSDVAFKLAQAALAKGEWPEPEKVRVEEFVNAFDYGDPAPGVTDKVACRTEQCAHPFLQQRNLLRVALRTAAVGRGSGKPLRLTILLDHSGSMQREDREASVKRAMEVLAGQLQPSDQVSLMGFARTPRLLADRISGGEAGKLIEAVEAAPSEGGTNLEEAVRLAAEVAERQFDDDAVNRIVLMTDGAANLGNADPQALARRVVELRQRGIAFDACGVGAKGLNDEVLEALTRDGDGRYYFLDSPDQADSGFASQLAGALRPAAKNVKVQMVFNPERVGAYRLLGFEKHRLKKEDFRNDAVDAAEMAADEAGVALYQIEPKADGRGDIGEVRVRFQDVASGRMIEHSWIIPYEANAPAIGDATPSMQLAGAAALFGEYLRGGPEATNVELEALSRLAPSLRSAFGENVRVNQLNDMIREARMAK